MAKLIQDPEPPSATLEEELQREVGFGHPLWMVRSRAIAFCAHDPFFNEFLFLTSSRRMPLAWVHLTWTVEASFSRYPRTQGYQTWEAFWSAWGNI
jgi:hypothetical protein